VTVLFLASCFPLTSSIRPIQLATPEEMAAAQASTWLVSGFGTTSEGAGDSGQGGALARALQYAPVKPVDCSTSYNSYYVGKEICAGNVPSVNGDVTPPYTDTCQGDSGGPLIFSTLSATAPVDAAADGDRLVGVTSWVRLLV
jgi:secreted trypsin-like serine protease